MFLIIENPEGIDYSDFCDYLIEEMQLRIYTELNIDLLNSIESVVNDILKADTYLILPLVISESVNYLIWEKYNDKDYIIHLDEQKKIPNTNLTYFEVIKLINFGNLQLNAYPIYTNLMEDMAKDLQEYYFEFMEG